jgi:hypothetical protein
MGLVYRPNHPDANENGLVSRETAGEPEGARSDLPFPRIMSDVMEPVQSMLDGRMYDSKSALRATYRAAGVIEVGNDPARLRPRQRRKVDRRAVKDTIERATARFERGERA